MSTTDAAAAASAAVVFVTQYTAANASVRLEWGGTRTVHCAREPPSEIGGSAGPGGCSCVSGARAYAPRAEESASVMASTAAGGAAADAVSLGEGDHAYEKSPKSRGCGGNQFQQQGLDCVG